MEEFHGEKLSFPPQTWKAQVQTCVVQRRWSKIHLKALIKGHIEEEQFLLNQHNLSNFWIIYINPHFLFLPKNGFCILYILSKKNFGGSNRLPVIPTPSLQHLGPGDWRSGRWAPPRWVAKRRVRSRSSGGSQGLGPDAHRCGDGLKGVSDGESWSGTYK